MNRLPERPLEPRPAPATEPCPLEACEGECECVDEQPGRYGCAYFVCLECGHEWKAEPEVP